jgi:hypothetical protein
VVAPGSSRVGSTTALLIWGSIILVIADDIVYLDLVGGQGGVPDTVATIPFVSGYVLLMAVLLALSLLSRRWIVTVRPAMLAAVAASLLLLGVFGAFSIGVPLLIAAILTAIAAVRALAGRNATNGLLLEVAGAAIALIVLVGGFEVTQRMIICPPTGEMGGSSSGFITGSYHYQCINGTLTFYPGDCNGQTGGTDANGNPISSNGC